MYRRTGFASDEDAAHDYLENLPPPPDDSQAPAYLPLPPDHYPDPAEPERPACIVPSNRFTKPEKPKQHPASTAASSPHPVFTAPSAPKAAPAASSPAPNDVKVTHPVGCEDNDDEPEYPQPPPYTPPPLGPKPHSFLRSTGSKLADLFFTVFGWLCFCIPVGIIVLMLGSWLYHSVSPLLAKPTPSPTAAPSTIRPVPTPQHVSGPFTAEDVRRMLGESTPTPTPKPSTSHSSSGSGSSGGGHTTDAVVGSLSRTVYWTSGGKSYHFDPDCYHLARSSSVHSGTLAEARATGKKDPCDDCVPQG